MNPGRYFIPNMNFVPFRTSLPISSINSQNIGLINRVFNGIKSFNWKGLLSGANKTINVVNQTIPLIKQAKPMINNVKSIVSLTKAFTNETNNKNTNKIKKNNNIENYKVKINSTDINNNSNYPTFFI